MKNRKRGFTPLEKTTNFRAGYKSIVEDSGLMQPSSFVRGQGSLTAFTLVELLVVIVIIAFSLSLCAALGPSMNMAEEAANRALCANRLRQIGMVMVMYADSFDGYLPWYAGKDPSFKAPFNCLAKDTPNSNAADACPKDNEIHPFNAFRDTPAEWRDENGNCRPFRLGCLYASGIVEDARLFYCPSATDPLYQYESYIKPLLPNTSTQWGTLPQVENQPPPAGHGSGNQYVRTGYIYYPTSPDDPRDIGNNYVPKYTCRRFDPLDSRMPYLTDYLWKRENPTPKELAGTGGRPKPITHQMGGVYSVNALFKDGHVFYCKNQAVFTNQLWHDMEASGMTNPDYRQFFYEEFQAIGNCSRGQEPWPDY